MNINTHHSLSVRGSLRMLLRHPLFWAGIVLKLILGSVFGSDYLINLFIPFVEYFVQSGFENPYEYFSAIDLEKAFPYPAMMLWILATPRILLGFLFGNSPAAIGHLALFVYRLPLLLADLGILLILYRWLKRYGTWTLLLYWLNPVLIYISYVHGQLDVIPIFFLCSAIYMLLNKRFVWAFALLSLGVACKNNIFLLLPFFAVYMYRHNYGNWMRLIISVLAFPLIYLLINAPFLGNTEFYQMVFRNTEQSKIFGAAIPLKENLQYYIIPAIYFLMFLAYMEFKRFNRDILIYFIAFSFSLITLFIPPMQGWYYWCLPFIIYAVIRHLDELLLPFSLLNGFYFLYFLVIPNSDFVDVWQVIDIFDLKGNFFAYLQAQGVDPSKAVNLSFTLLQTALLLTCLRIYQTGIRANLKSKLLYKPFMLGVGGGSGAGKTTFTGWLEELLGAHNVTIVRGDDMHKWERGDKNWQVYTHLHPKANLLHKDLEQTRVLASNRNVERRSYNHKDGRFTLPSAVRSNKLVIYEGLHPFYLENQRAIYDLKVFMAPQEDLHLSWKVARDMKERGYSEEKVIEQLRSRESDSKQFIKGQEKFADMVVRFEKEGELVSLCLKFENTLDLEPLIEEFENCGLDIDHEMTEFKQELCLRGNISSEQLEHISFNTMQDLDDYGIYEPQWKDGLPGLLQLITLHYILFKVKLQKYG